MATKKITDETVEAVETAEAAATVTAEAEAKPAAKKAAPKAEKAAAEKPAKPAKEAVAEKPEAEEAAEKPAKKEKAAAEPAAKAEKPAPAKKEKAEKEPAAKAEKPASAKKEKAAKAAPAKPANQPRLKQRYADEVLPALQEQFGYKNVMQVPRLEKIIINMGLGAEKDNPKGMEAAAKELGLIAGQKAVITKAKKSVANFKVREGMNIGVKVTLRGERMYFFADKLMNIVLPRVRDFRGISDKAFDGRGNFAMGLKEQLIFPEINYDDVDKVRGMNIVFVTSAKTDEEAKALLQMLGMPFVQGA